MSGALPCCRSFNHGSSRSHAPVCLPTSPALNHSQVSLYNLGQTAPQMLHKGRRIAIIEPFYKRMTGGLCMLTSQRHHLSLNACHRLHISVFPTPCMLRVAGPQQC
jgi:hypothetical protein